MHDPRAAERGASLVSVVIVLVILGGLAAIAVAALPDDPSGTDELRTPNGRAGTAAPGGAGGGARSPVAVANVDACLITAKTLKTAADARHAADGTYPADTADLVKGGYLSEVPTVGGYVFRMEAKDNRPTGRVLVNDLPADQGCAAPRTAP